MSADDSVLSALRAAHNAQPENNEIALHLTELLLERGADEEALEIVQAVLARAPTDTPALALAVSAAQACQRHDVAAAYSRLLSALGGAETAKPEPVPQVPSTPQPTPQVPDLNDNGRPRLRVVGGNAADEVDEPDFDAERPDLTLADVGGMEEVKKRLQLSFLGPLQQPELMNRFGKRVGGGLLLYGPPGCGKTFIARALAGELGARFMSIGIADVLDMYVGESERKLHEWFESARQRSPTVLFFDELDALGQKRSQLRNSGMRSLVNQLLAEMDSIGSENEQVYVLGATNHPWDVDSALRRPGRFDRMVAVMPPDEPARRSILEYHARNKPLAADVDFDVLVAGTRHWSGADLSLLVEGSVDWALADSIASGEMREVHAAYFTQTMAGISPSTRDWFETARNVALFANHSRDYDAVTEYLKRHNL